MRGGQIYGERLRSAHPPTLHLIAPRRGAHLGGRGQLVIRWKAADADRDRLEATVEFSANGGRSWRPVFIGASKGSARVPAWMVPRSGKARVRVTVNDGFNQATARSAIFVSRGGRPIVEVSSPLQMSESPRVRRSLSPEGASAVAVTSSRGRSLTWLDGRHPLGHGAQFSLSQGLASGRHVLRLRARDAGGRVASKAVIVHVTGELRTSSPCMCRRESAGGRGRRSCEWPRASPPRFGSAAAGSPLIVTYGESDCRSRLVAGR